MKGRERQNKSKTQGESSLVQHLLSSARRWSVDNKSQFTEEDKKSINNVSE